MGLLSSHKCSGPKLHCVKCNSPICPQCLTATSSAMMCKRCVPRKGPNLQTATGDIVKLQAASVGAGVVVFGILGFFTSCMT